MLAIDLLQNWVMIWAHIVKVDWGILMDRAIEQLSLVFLNLLHLQTYSIYSKKTNFKIPKTRRPSSLK